MSPAPAPAPLTQEDLLRQQAAARAQEDYFNTNIMQSDDPNLKIAQDVVVTTALSQAVEHVTIDVLKHSLIRALEGRKPCIEFPITNSIKKIKLSLKEVDRIIQKATERAKSIAVNGVKHIKSANMKTYLEAAVKLGINVKNAVKNAGKIVKDSGKIARNTVKIATTAIKAGVQAAKVMTESAIKSLTSFTAICALFGAETAGLGCVAAIAISVIMMAFDAFNLAMDLVDPNGISILIYKKDIELIADMTGKWVKNDPDLNPKNDPNFLDEEIFFDYKSFQYEFDQNDNITINQEFADKYEYHRDQYMAGIGITGDWRSRLEGIDASKVTDPGVLGPTTLVIQELTNEIKKGKKNPADNTLLFIIILFVVIFLIFIILFFII
jgi:hypothetical protein